MFVKYRTPRSELQLPASKIVISQCIDLTILYSPFARVAPPYTVCDTPFSQFVKLTPPSISLARIHSFLRSLRDTSIVFPLQKAIYATALVGSHGHRVRCRAYRAMSRPRRTSTVIIPVVRQMSDVRNSRFYSTLPLASQPPDGLPQEPYISPQSEV